MVDHWILFRLPMSILRECCRMRYSTLPRLEKLGRNLSLHHYVKSLKYKPIRFGAPGYINQKLPRKDSNLD